MCPRPPSPAAAVLPTRRLDLHSTSAATDTHRGRWLLFAWWRCLCSDRRFRHAGRCSDDSQPLRHRASTAEGGWLTDSQTIPACVGVETATGDSVMAVMASRLACPSLGVAPPPPRTNIFSAAKACNGTGHRRPPHLSHVARRHTPPRAAAHSCNSGTHAHIQGVACM